MSWIKRTFGIDGVDLAIQAGVTVAVMAVGGQIWSHGAAVTMIASVGGASLLVLGVRRHFARRRNSLTMSEDVAAARIEELEARLAEMEQGESRVYELEERLDFAERLLAQAREPERLT